MFTLNKLTDTLSHVGGVFGEVEAARRLSLLAGAAGSNFVEERNFV